MDFHLRQLENEYKNTGDLDAGAQYLSALIRSGDVPIHKAELAAIYQHPVAMRLFGGKAVGYGEHRPEERVLPLDRNNFNDIAPWTCEVYQRRLLSLVSWALDLMLEHDAMEDETLATNIVDIVQDKIERKGLPLFDNQLFELQRSATLRSLDYMGMDYWSRAHYYLWMSLGALVKSLSCDNDSGIISDSGPAWACVSASNLEAHLGLRDPTLPENPEKGFGANILEGAYLALRDGLSPWLLQPFPL